MTDKRPVNLSIPTIRLPITAYVSILHRVSGVVLIAAFGIFLYYLHFSLASETDFNKVLACIHQTPVKLILWACLAALAYHTCAGIRHLIMDMGIGEDLKGGVLGARLALVAAAILIGLSFFWVMSW